ncbi:4'-phosphopantetheinyl transferase family protein [Snuella sedimenti]|uniref:4'-phosphopantetheinyl transferase superfamily protein n=1 Tax=Snuella sedimenti TaxID=2798802 RepID=A0A8J7J4M2_9FLAO|nr:4'-phosphopantetheinyl transferase superfamily protein [Snuella sedimenti]MBJ6369817.1 4'-phosphopantetheinyl transferase superfamily protein [Snuella sedimenti]
MKVIEIFYTKFTEELPKSLFHDYLNLLPRNLQEKNSRILRWQDKHSNLFGKILLMEALKRHDFRSCTLKEIKYNKYKRPYFEADFDFNISHSGEYVVCAMGENIKLGVDIEKIVDIDFSHFSKTMTPDQWKEILFSINPSKTFFKYWTLKESIIKADGRGLSIPLLEIVDQNNIVHYENINWYINRIEIDKEYAMCLVTNNENLKISMRYVDFYQKEIIQ